MRFLSLSLDKKRIAGHYSSKIIVFCDKKRPGYKLCDRIVCCAASKCKVYLKITFGVHSCKSDHGEHMAF